MAFHAQLAAGVRSYRHCSHISGAVHRVRLVGLHHFPCAGGATTVPQIDYRNAPEEFACATVVDSEIVESVEALIEGSEEPTAVDPQSIFDLARLSEAVAVSENLVLSRFGQFGLSTHRERTDVPVLSGTLGSMDEAFEEHSTLSHEMMLLSGDPDWEFVSMSTLRYVGDPFRDDESDPLPTHIYTTPDDTNISQGLEHERFDSDLGLLVDLHGMSHLRGRPQTDVNRGMGRDMRGRLTPESSDQAGIHV